MSLNKAPENNVFYRNQNWHYPKISHGSGVYLYGTDGREYIDACSGSAVCNIGHGNAEIAEYTAQQSKKLAFTHLSIWTTDTIEECAAAVVKWMPAGLEHVYFVSGGSEATETAIKMARQYFVEKGGAHASKYKVISKWNSFHGNTLGSLSMTGITERRRIYAPILLDFPKIPQFYHYRNPWNCKDPYETGVKAAEALELEIIRQGPGNVAAFITEVVVGAAAPGVNPDPVYFQKVREICDKYDVLLIVDEVMSGFGRTGRKFASDHYNLIPDIITVAKGMSCGYTPIGAAVCNRKIFDTIMVKGSGVFVHGHTYAANPLSCGISTKIIAMMERDKIVENAAAAGAILMPRMQEFYKYPIVGDIRGKGLMIGVELVKCQADKTPFEPAEQIKNKIRSIGLEEGIVLYPGGGTVDGLRGDHFLLAPPLNITENEIEILLERLERTIARTTELAPRKNTETK